MTREIFSRQALLLGDEAMERLRQARGIVFGAGGVGGAAIEALARAGIGSIDVVDPDDISLSNLNRQLLATTDTVGTNKAQAACDRIARINPECKTRAHRVFYTAEDHGGIDVADYDFVIDAIDTVSSKLHLIELAQASDVIMLSSMGTGNKLDPTRLQVSDISKTNTCPLAAVIRRECRRRGIKRLRVVWSDEVPLRAVVSDGETGRHAPGSISYVPPVAGMILAAEAVRLLLGK